MKAIEPGCLAIIINSSPKENNGKVVRCVEKICATPNSIITLPGGRLVAATGNPAFLVEAINGPLLINTTQGRQYSALTGICRISHLVRIGDDSVQDVLKKVVENVE